MSYRWKGEPGSSETAGESLRRLDRRDFLKAALAAPVATVLSTQKRAGSAESQESPASEASGAVAVTICLAGDVMTGRGIDQILSHPSDPVLYEPRVTDARDYVDLAQRVNGDFTIPVGDSYLWGFALDKLRDSSVDARIVNLETSVTTSPTPWPDKGIHYRMHPRNVGGLTCAGLDCCCLANNHVLDWGLDGLLETLDTLAEAGIRAAGAGRSLEAARAPAVLEVRPRQRVLVLARASITSGVPADWAATPARPGVALLARGFGEAIAEIRSQLDAHRRPGDIGVVSIHWGPNWGYRIPDWQRRFARQLIDQAGVDLIHGHSSHHVKRIEVYRGAPILYGCGDLLTDYEGIAGREQYRGDLGLLYFPRFRSDRGGLESLEMVPTQMRRMRLARPSSDDRRWLAATLDRESRPFRVGVVDGAEGKLDLRWPGSTHGT